MARRLVFAFGVLLLLAGILGFLASAVALATADDPPGIQPSRQGVELTLSPDDPLVIERRIQAEMVLFGSLLCGGIGFVLTGVTVWLGRRTSRRPSP